MLLNLHSPTIFFDNQLLLGSSLGVLALMEFGWAGLPVGLAAALSTVGLLGHPWTALVLILLLVWQQCFLQWFNGGRAQVGNGHIVLATMAFWPLLGLPLFELLYSSILGIHGATAVSLGLKEGVVTVFTAGLALVAHLLLLLVRRARGLRDDLPMRGLAFGTLLMAISLPTILTILVLGWQLTVSHVEEQCLHMEHRAEDLLHVLATSSTSQWPLHTSILSRSTDTSFEAIGSDGRLLSTAPELFETLASDYRDSRIRNVMDPKLRLMVNAKGGPRPQQMLRGYWVYRLEIPAQPEAGPWRRITVAEPARDRIEQLLNLMRPGLLLLAALLMVGALLSEALATALATQFSAVLQPLQAAARLPGQKPSPLMPRLPGTRIRELNQLVAALNQRGQTVNDLSLSLLETNSRLRLSEQQHRLLADNALDVIALLDAEGRPSYISPSIRKLRGWTPEQAWALPFRRHLRRQGQRAVVHALRQIRQALRDGTPVPSFRFEMEQSHSNGSWIWTDVTISGMSDSQGTYLGTLVVCRDVGERRRAVEQRLQELEQKLRTSLTAGAVGHEISQPIASLQLANRLMLDVLRKSREGKLDPQLAGQLEPLLEAQHEAGEEVMGTIDVMRRLLRMQTRPMENLNLSELTATVLKQVRSQPIAAGVIFQDEGLAEPCLIRGDGDQFEVALSNLLRNALQAVALRPAGERRVLVGLCRLASTVELRVEDSGPGFAPGMVEALPLHTTKPEGSGLGLYLVRTTLNNHGGRLKVGRSRLGGALLTMELPLGPTDEEDGDPTIGSD